MYYLFFLLTTVIGSKQECLKKNSEPDSYYLKGEYIIEGIELGNENLYVELINATETEFTLKVYLIENSNDTVTVSGISSHILKPYKKDMKFKREKLLGNTNNNGFITLSKNLKADYISIELPGFSPHIIRYNDFVNCLNAD